MAAPVEREVKLGAWPGFHLPDFEVVAPGVHASVGEPLRMEATYYDAPDLRLIRAGVTLRHRTGEPGAPGGRWTAKLPRTESTKGDQGVLERFEIDVDGPADTIPPELVRLVRGRLRTAEMVAVARLQTVRRLVGLVDDDGRRVGEVADDEVSVLENGRVAARFREVEAEVTRDAPPDLLDLLVASLRAAGASDPDPTPKLVRALGPRALAPPDPPLPELDADSTVGEVVQAAISSAVRRLSDHDPIVRLDAGPTGVHQSRVAMRRLRSDLRTFRNVVDPDWVATFAGDLKWLADELGRVRDADVLLKRLEAACADMGADAEAARLVVERLSRQRDRALAELQGALSSERYLGLLDRLVEAGRAPRVVADADRPAAKVLPSLASRPWRKLKRAVEELDDDPADDELHEVRILAKRARYAAEAASGVLPDAAAHGKAIAGLQDVLGDHHDTVVAEHWLRDAVQSGATRDEAFAVGLLVAAERAERVAKRAAWRDAWDAARAKKVRAWLGS